MKSEPTIKNHFNPCYWTAYWNFKYLNFKRNGDDISKNPRDHTVFCLNIQAKKILIDKTKNIFIDKNAGIASIENEKEFIELRKKSINNFDFEFEEENLILDFENHFTEFENLTKSSIEKTIISKEIDSIEDKALIAFFIFMQYFRNHKNLTELTTNFLKEGKSKLQLFLNLKDSVTDKEKLASILFPIVFCKWKIYKTDKAIFPLTDNCVLLRKNHLFFPLCPDILIEINLNKKTEEICSYSTKISKWKYWKFKNRTIKYLPREIIFGNEKILTKWSKDKRLPTTVPMKSNNRLLF